MKLTLLFLGRNGAGPKYAFEMTKELAQCNNIDLQIVIPDNIDNLKDWESINTKFNNIHLHLVKTYSTKKEFLLSFINFIKLKKIANVIKNFDPNWIYMPMGSLLNFGILPHLQKYKKVYTLHDPILHSGEKSFFIEQLKRIEIKSSQKIILLNNFFKKMVVKNYNIKTENIEVIPHAGFFSKEKPNFLEDFTFSILFLGRIEKYKGIDLLLDALEIVLETNKRVILTIAGKGNLLPYAKKIDKLKDHIILKNDWLSENDIERLLKNNDFVVLPYIDASQSGVIPLAFGNGKTVISTNVGALAEQIPSGFGYCVNPDPNEIAEAIISIYSAPYEELYNKNNQAYQYATDNLTWASSVKKLLKCLE